MKKGSAKAVSTGKRTCAQKLQYVKKNWQLYVFFLMPALLLDHHLQICTDGRCADRI